MITEKMPVLYSYIIREILKYTSIVLTTVVGIYMSVDFFERIDNFLEAGLPVTKTLIYLIYKIPFIISQIMPVAVLLAVLITFGLMTKHNEIIALKSAGISIYSLLKPVIVMGFIFSIFLFIFSEIIVPFTAAKSNKIWLQEVKKRSAVISREKNVWIKDNSLITHLKYYDKTKQSVYGLTIYSFDKDFNLVKRIDAEKGVFKKNQWILFNFMKQVLNKETEKYKVTFHEKQEIDLGFSPQDLETVVKKSEEMSFKELYHYVKKVEAEGYDATLYKVDFHAKAAFPFICLILSIIGISISARAKIKESLPTGIAYGIGIAFLYWIFYSFCLSLGYGGMLPPVIASWTANFVFSCYGVFRLLNTE